MGRDGVLTALLYTARPSRTGPRILSDRAPGPALHSARRGPMRTLDRYLLVEFAQSVSAALVVLLIVSVGGVFADVLRDIADGTAPAGMLLSQLGLVLLTWLPLILPLALMLGLMLATGRLYRDAEMHVIAAAGVGPRRLLRPLLYVVGPVLLLVAACSLWLGPWAQRVSREMINEANKSLIVAGLEPGAFTELPGGGGVIYVGAMQGGTQFQRVFVYREDGDRMDVVSAPSGRLQVDREGERYITLDKGFEVEGPLAGAALDYRLMRYASNEVHLPSGNERYDPDSPKMKPTLALIGDNRPNAAAQLHERLTPPLLTLAFALMALPLARSAPRQARYGRVMMGFLAYLIGINLMRVGTGWLEDGKLPPAAGLWWLTLPLLVLGAWLYFRDGQVGRPRRVRA